MTGWGLRGAQELGEVNAEFAKTKDGLWMEAGVAECVFVLQKR